MKKPILAESFYPIEIKKNISMPLYITSVGKCIQDEVDRKKGMASFQLLYTAEGCGKAEVDGKKYILEKNSILFSSANIPIKYYPASSPWVTYWITFSGNAADNMFRRKKALWHTNTQFNFIEQYKKIINLKDSLLWQKKSTVYLYELILNCIELMPQSAESISIEKKLAPAMEYINKYFFSDIEIKELAALCGISFEHFCRCFKACTGSRPIEYITALKISRAKSYLRSGFSVSETAKLCGFSTLAYFCKQFKKHTKTTPTEFKKH